MFITKVNFLLSKYKSGHTEIGCAYLIHINNMVMVLAIMHKTLLKHACEAIQLRFSSYISSAPLLCVCEHRGLKFDPYITSIASKPKPHNVNT